jgi:hypothetical protein
MRGSDEILEEAAEGVSLDLKKKTAGRYILFGGEGSFEDLKENLHEIHEEFEQANKHYNKDKVEDCLQAIERGWELYHVKGESIDEKY